MSLDEKIRPYLKGDELIWYCENHTKLVEQPDEKTLYLAISFATRKVGKAHIILDDDPRDWTIDQAVRVAFLAIINPQIDTHKCWIDRLWSTADQNELVAFYQGIDYLPEPLFWLDKALFAARSNMSSVFLAIAYQNKYPSVFFSEDAWNQLVLKALCLNLSLLPIKGLMERMNVKLRDIFYDNVLDQWAANRPVNPELWMCMAQHLDEKVIGLLATVLEQKQLVEQLSAIWSLQHSHLESAKKLLANYESLQALVTETGFSLYNINKGVN